MPHDFGPTGFCYACALPFTRRGLPCRPSTDDSPEACAEVAEMARG